MSVMGTLLHFLFDWMGRGIVVGMFSAVNESIWEHMKLLYWPMLMFALVEYALWGKEQPGFWHVKLLGTLAGLLLIPVLFYTYTGVFGVMIDWLNIAIFFVTAVFVFWMETKLLESKRTWPDCRLSFWGLCLIGAAFWVLTFWPASIPLFQDPVTGTYGYQS